MKIFATIILTFVSAVPVIAQGINQAGTIHIPIGSVNALDALKTFVEDNGSFSPGLMSFGVYPAFREKSSGLILNPKRDKVEHSLVDGYLIPQIKWEAEGIKIVSEICQVDCPISESFLKKDETRYEPAKRSDSVPVVAWRISFTNGTDTANSIDKNLEWEFTPYITNKGPAGGGNTTQRYRFPIGKDTSSPKKESIPALIPGAEFFIFNIGMLRPGETRVMQFVFPVHAGEFVQPHKWVEYPRQYVMVDANKPVKSEAEPVTNDMLYIPDPGEDFFRGLNVDDLFVKAKEYWSRNSGTMKITTPDKRWNQGFTAMIGHAGMCMNDGDADVAVVNYNVFNRDGMYIANMMQKAGLDNWSEIVIDNLLEHPFNGRPYPEADNPGQVLWSAEQQWLLTKNTEWLKRVYPGIRQIANMIVYYRTTEGPHWVSIESALFGSDLPAEKRQEFKQGRCDGYQPIYTEAFDLAGLRAATAMAKSLANQAETKDLLDDIRLWSETANKLATDYDAKYSKKLPEEYGSYSVLWPCRVYSYNDPKVVTQFGNIGAVNPSLWRYFAPAMAHQSLLAGNREAGWKTINLHLDHPQMRNWFAFDEGGWSGSGGWQYMDTDWQHSKEKPGINYARAMPHGWAIAEVWLLMRDALFFESDDELVLLAGIPAEWFADANGITVENAPTAFGVYSFTLKSGKLTITGKQKPPKGFRVQTPDNVKVDLIWEQK